MSEVRDLSVSDPWPAFTWVGPAASLAAFKVALETDLPDSTKANLWGPAYGTPPARLDTAGALGIFSVAISADVAIKVPPDVLSAEPWLARAAVNFMAQPDVQDGKTRAEKRPRDAGFVSVLEAAAAVKL